MRKREALRRLKLAEESIIRVVTLNKALTKERDYYKSRLASRRRLPQWTDDPTLGNPYLYVSDQPHVRRTVEMTVLVDLAADDAVVGIEFLDWPYTFRDGVQS